MREDVTTKRSIWNKRFQKNEIKYVKGTNDKKYWEVNVADIKDKIEEMTKKKKEIISTHDF